MVTDREAASVLPAFDLTDPAFYQDPYPIYEALRATYPVFRSPHGPWVVSRFADVERLLRDARLSVGFTGDPRWVRHRGGEGSTAVQDARRWMLLKDGAAHAGTRHPFNRYLTPRAVAARRDTVRQAVRSATAGLAGTVRLTGTAVDIVADLAEPVVAAAARDLLGLPRGHEDQCRGWSRAIIRMADPVCPPPVRAEIDHAMTDFRAFIERADRGGSLEPRGLASEMLHDHRRRRDLTVEDVIANLVMVFMAATDTTVGQVASAVWALCRHPDQLALAVDDPTILEAAVLEFTRYEPPVQVVSRRLVSELALYGHTMRSGEIVMLLLGSASRDADRYANPDRLDLRRDNVTGLAFGAGPHYCLGAGFAQLIVGITIAELVRSYPMITLVDEVLQWRRSVVGRRLERLRAVTQSAPLEGDHTHVHEGIGDVPGAKAQPAVPRSRRQR